MATQLTKYLLSKGITRAMLLDLPSIGDMFQFQVNKYFTDINGTIIAKAAAPAGMRVKYPVYLLGNYDRNGGYRQAQKMIPPIGTNVYLGSFVYGIDQVPAFLQLTGLNNIKSLFKFGDIITIYADSFDAASCFCWIIQTNTQVAVGSFVQNSETVRDGRVTKLRVANQSYQVDTVDQYNEQWNFLRIANTGIYENDPVDVKIYKTPNYKLTDFIVVKAPFEISQYIGINFYMIDTCDLLSINLNFLK
jgi:hypothetical protein